MNKNLYLPLFLCSVSIFVSCAAPDLRKEKVTPDPVIEKKAAGLPVREQEKKSLEVFNDILELTNVDDPSVNTDKKVELYSRIIRDYPDAPLAQESYWRLIEAYLNEYNPPKKDKMIPLYGEYRERYPDSPLRNAVDYTITRFYYRNGYWNELLSFALPDVKEFINTGKLRGAIPMFVYSEAKFHLDDYKEAYKGYMIVVKKFPGSSEAKAAKKRIAEIKKKFKRETTEVK